jgi:hypothetical protein
MYYSEIRVLVMQKRSLLHMNDSTEYKTKESKYKRCESNESKTVLFRVGVSVLTGRAVSCGYLIRRWLRE